MRRRRSFTGLIAATLTAGLLCISSADAKKPGGGGGGSGGGGVSYQIIALDDAAGTVHDGWANDINNRREVVGYVDDAITGTGRYAAYWSIGESNGEISSTLSLLADGISATGINDAGEIVGSGDDGNGGFVGLYWSDANALPLELPPLTGHDRSTAQAINDDGVICGISGVGGGGWQSSRSVTWRVNWNNGVPSVVGPVELPADGSQAIALTDNDANGVALVVGYSLPTNTAALAWSVQSLGDGSLTATGPAIIDVDAQASGINNSGIVCGQRGSLAVLWDGVSTTTLQRPTKGKHAVPWTTALDISDTGIIVGRAGPGNVDSRAVVWPSADGNMTYLDSFLDSNSPLLGLNYPEAVNDSGEIVGGAWNGAFAAIPRP